MLTHGSLFSGIGGFDLAAAWAGIPTLWQVESDLFCRMVLKKHFPETKQYEEIKGLTGLQAVDIISGGYPCQPFSVAGNKRGKEDHRFLWPEMFAVIKEVRPRWCIVENVPGIIHVVLDDCIAALEGEGYEVGTIVLPACAQNAPHRRDRVFVIGNLSNARRNESRSAQTGNGKGQSAHRRKRAAVGSGFADCGHSKDVGNSKSKQSMQSGLQPKEPLEIRGGRSFNTNWWQSEPNVGRVAARIPARVDRLKSLGNAVVPQIAFRIFEAIKEIENAE